MATKSREYDTKSVVGFKELINKDYNAPPLKHGLPMGTVGSIEGDGVIGKGMFALETSLSVATADEGSQYMRGGVFYMGANGRAAEMERRVQAISRAFSFDERKNELAQKNFRIWPLLGEVPDILEKTDKGERPLVNAICNIAKTYEHDPLRLIFFDTLRRFSSADESDGGQMSAVLACMELICKRLNCCCVFLRNASRVSSVLSDNVKYQEKLRLMTVDEAEELGEVINGCVRKSIGWERDRFVEWSVIKQNYSSPTLPVWLKRNNGGVLMPVEIGYFDKYKRRRQFEEL